MISMEQITLKYRSGKGITDITFSVKSGGVTGYLGPNGAGKTTTIRCLMGFMKPDSGACAIGGLDCYRDAAKVKEIVGYIPGEIAFPSGMSCMQYLRYQCELRGIRNLSRMKALIERFDLDTKGSMKHFSKGMKQKVGIVAAFMSDPRVLILDEPTSGLDPLMQNEFIKLVLEEKKRGKTILISSHMFEEVERTCDDVAIIKDGQILIHSDVKGLTSSKRKGYCVHTPDVEKLKSFGYETGEEMEDGCMVYVQVGVTFCLCTAVAMLSYFLSVAFCGGKWGTGLAVGVPIGLLFLQIIGGVGGEQTEWLSKITPFGYLDSVGIVTGEVSTLGLYLAFGGAIIVLLAASVYVFNRKRLPI